MRQILDSAKLGLLPLIASDLKASLRLQKVERKKIQGIERTFPCWPGCLHLLRVRTCLHRLYR
jgi:hypothetical protein